MVYPRGNNPDEYSGDLVNGIMVKGSVMDPMTGALISAGSNVLGKALSPSPAGPSNAESGGTNWLSFDHSGWTVATGKASATGGLAIPAWAWIAAAVVALAWVRRKKS